MAGPRLNFSSAIFRSGGTIWSPPGWSRRSSSWRACAFREKSLAGFPDILADGRLDLPNRMLSRLDLFVASVHYKFDLSRKAQTARIISAMDNRHVSIIGHPTGRLIGEREAYDLVHLSNILDWLTPEEARHTLQVARQALRPGGCVFIRQLNSTLDIPSLGEFFHWQEDESRSMHRRDRSFFYRAIHLGRKA